MPQKQLTIRINTDLYQQAKSKCQNQFGISLSPLVKIFLKAFITQKGVGFFIGDEDLRNIFHHWLRKKRLETNRKGCAPLPGPHLKDLYKL